MKKIMLAVAALAIAGFAIPAIAGDTCTCSAIAKSGTGWCDACKEGVVAGVQCKFKALVDAFNGTKVSASNMHCPACVKALASDGVCDHCHAAFVRGKEYHTGCPAVIGHGMWVTPAMLATVKCDDCKKHVEGKTDGYCDKCGGGIVSGMFFKGRENYDKAVIAVKLIKEAAGTKCEGCAVAIVTDGECAQCKVHFKDGKALKS